MIKLWWKKYLGFLALMAVIFGGSLLIIGGVCALIWIEDKTHISAFWWLPVLVLIGGAIGSWFDAKKAKEST
jgi:lipoprotein signal peptidase